MIIIQAYLGYYAITELELKLTVIKKTIITFIGLLFLQNGEFLSTFNEPNWL